MFDLENVSFDEKEKFNFADFIKNKVLDRIIEENGF